MNRTSARLLQLTPLLLLSAPLLFSQTPNPAPADNPSAPATEQVSVLRLKTPSQAGPPTALSSSLKRDIVPGRTVTLVTQNKPLLRQQCRVEKFDEDALTCRSKSGPVTYHAQDLVAVIGQERESGMPKPLRLLTTFGISAGALTGAALLASVPTAGISLAVVGAILLLESAFDATESNDSRHRERLLFLNPDQNLQIDLW